MKNSHRIILLLTISLLSLMTAVSIKTLRYFTIGYVTDAEDISQAGMQIWDIQNMFVVLIIATIISGLIAFIWQKLLKKQLTTWGLIALMFVIYVLAIVFFPHPFDFQIRHYNGSANSTYININGESADFIEGNEGVFMGTQDKMGTEVIYAKLPNGETDYSKETKPYDCVVQKSYWLGHIGVNQSFYPILDRKNGDRLIKQHCKLAKITVQ